LIKPTKHQKIWIRKNDKPVLKLPKIINSDIGFQLMFGYYEDYRKYVDKCNKYNYNYYTKIYSLNRFKK